MTKNAKDLSSNDSYFPSQRSSSNGSLESSNSFEAPSTSLQENDIAVLGQSVLISQMLTSMFRTFRPFKKKQVRDI